MIICLVTVQGYNGAEKSPLLTLRISPHIYDCHTIPMFMWLQFGCLAIHDHLQCPVVNR